MKFWTVSIAVLALSAASLAGGWTRSVSTATITSSNNVLMPASSRTTSISRPVNSIQPNGHGGNQCVPEPLTMLALLPGAALLIRRRRKA